MAPEHRETMQRGNVASNGCFPGQNLYHVPHYPRGFSSQTLDLKYAYGDKQANPHFKTDGSVNTEKLALSYECLGRPVNEENIYFWSGFSPNLFEEMHTQSHQFDGCLYPPNYRHYFPTNWLPQVPFRMIPQSYPLEYGLQDFQYFVVIDFEATCDKEKNPHPQEIIEFPSVLVNSRTGLLEDCFQIYVRPTHNQLLTDFCKELTGIQQSQVDKGVLLSEALLMHDKWLEDKGIKHTNFAIVTWSNWDCRVMLESECRFKRIMKPPYFNRWINLKIPFCEAFGGVRCNLKEAVDLAGLTWQGRAHCGLDDAKNTARLLSHLMNLGLKLSITSSIFWQSADCSQIIRHHHPYPHHQQIASPPEYRLPYQPQPQPQPEPHKWKTASVIAVIPYPTIQTESPVKELQVYCYCGAMSVKRVVRKPGPQHGSFFFGCGNWTANRGAICSFFKWASESAESAS